MDVFHWEGSETFDTSGSIPLTMDTLHDDRPLFVNRDIYAWSPRSDDLAKDMKCLKVKLDDSKIKEWFTSDWNEYHSLFDYSYEKNNYLYRDKLKNLIKMGYNMFTVVDQNLLEELPESMIINPTNVVKDIVDIDYHNRIKIVVAGSRSIQYSDLYNSHYKDLLTKEICKIVSALDRYPEIVSGGARGADRLGELVAKENNFLIKRFIPDWEKPMEGVTMKMTKTGRLYNPIAGHIRNSKMADYGDILIALWDGKSKGTENMIGEMVKRDKEFKIITTR